MSRRPIARIAAPLGLALLLVLGIAAPALACDGAPDARTSTVGDDDSTGVATGQDTTTGTTPPRPAISALAAGAVNRTSVNLSATYAVSLTLDYASRSFMANTVATITNTSGGPIDRIELNTIAARLGRMSLRAVQVNGTNVARRVSDQTVIVPLGGVLAAGDTVQVRVHYVARLRSSLGGSDWMFTRVNGIVDAYRWIPWVSRATPFTRPNHGDPFVTPVSPEVTVTVRDRSAAGHRVDRRPGVTVGRRPNPALRRAQCARRDDHRGARLPDRDRSPSGPPRCATTTGRRPTAR